MGDDTWEALFPGEFTESYPYSSFDVQVNDSLSLCYRCLLSKGGDSGVDEDTVSSATSFTFIHSVGGTVREYI